MLLRDAPAFPAAPAASHTSQMSMTAAPAGQGHLAGSGSQLLGDPPPRRQDSNVTLGVWDVRWNASRRGACVLGQCSRVRRQAPFEKQQVVSLPAFKVNQSIKHPYFLWSICRRV